MEIELYNGDILEFPDDTPNEVVDRVAKKETFNLRLKERKATNPAEYDPYKYSKEVAAEGVGAIPRLAGNMARIGVKSIVGLPLLAADAGVGIRNLFGGNYEMPSATFNQALDSYIPAPPDTLGKAVEFLGSALIGSRYAPSPDRLSAKSAQAPSNYKPADPFAVESTVDDALYATDDAVVTGQARPSVSYGTVGADESAGLSAAQKDIAGRVRKLGMKLTPGKAAGSQAMQQLEAKAESQPFSSGPFNALKANNAKIVNRSFLQAIGEKGDEITEASIRNADDRIGKVFENAALKNRIKYDDALESSLAEIEQHVSQEVGKSGIGVIGAQLKEIIDKAAQNGGALTGRQFQNIRMALSRVSNNSDASVGYWARQIREKLDDALFRSVRPEDVMRLTNAREQYRVLITAMNSNSLNTAKGAVSPGLLVNALSRADKAGFVKGGNQSNLYNALRFYKAFPSVVGDSGTATRMPFNGLTDLAMRIPGSILSRAYLSGPATAAAPAITNASRRVGAAFEQVPDKAAITNALLIQMAR